MTRRATAARAQRPGALSRFPLDRQRDTTWAQPGCFLDLGPRGSCCQGPSYQAVAVSELIGPALVEAAQLALSGGQVLQYFIHDGHYTGGCKLRAIGVIVET
jgi:hypothetical protein